MTYVIKHGDTYWSSAKWYANHGEDWVQSQKHAKRFCYRTDAEQALFYAVPSERGRVVRLTPRIKP